MRFLKHFVFDLLLWFLMYNLVVDSSLTPYAYNALAFIYGFKTFLAFLVILGHKHIKVTKLPSKPHMVYVDVTVLLETLVLAAFGFTWMAIASAFGWFIFGSLLRNKGKEQNAPQG